MTKMFLLAVLTVSIFTCGQNNPKTKIDLTVNQDSIVHINKCIAFIKNVNQQDMADKNFILVDKPFEFEYIDCIADLLSDTATFTKDELSFIEDKKYPSLKKWTTELFRNTKLLRSDTLNAIFKDNLKWWPYFNKHVGRSFNIFSVPIFLRKDNYCLFYSSHHCGGLCGGGSLALYKKENNKWTKVRSYCDWIS
jgi:hypothetical protein